MSYKHPQVLRTVPGRKLSGAKHQQLYLCKHSPLPGWQHVVTIPSLLRPPHTTSTAPGFYVIFSCSPCYHSS